MASEWITCSLGELFKVKHGFAFKGKYFTEETADSLLVTPGNFVVKGGFQNLKPKYYNGPIPDDYVLAPRQVVVTMTDLSKKSDTLGLAAEIPEDDYTWLHNQRIGLLQFKDEILTDPRFISYLLRTHAYRSWVIGSASGTTVKHTSPGRIESFECDIPPLVEQKSIAHILGTLDDKIELNRQMNATLEAMAQALFKSWFIDFDPVIDNALAAGHTIPEPLHAHARAHAHAETRKALGDQRKPLPEAIQRQFPNRFVFNEDMGWVPEGWEVSTVGDEIETTGGGTPSTKNPSFWENGTHAFCTPKDMSTLGSIVLMDTGRHLTDEGVNKISSGQLPRGVVLMSSRAPIGYLAISDIPVSVNQGIIAMLPSTNFGSMYLLNWTHFNMPAIKDRANGSTFLEISKRNFKPIPFLIPNGQIGGFFNEQAQGIYAKLVLGSEQIRELSTIRDTLLPKLISGQLRIPDAEKQVSDLA
jgi:type I restriction enzyme S subunit